MTGTPTEKCLRLFARSFPPQWLNDDPILLGQATMTFPQPIEGFTPVIFSLVDLEIWQRTPDPYWFRIGIHAEAFDGGAPEDPAHCTQLILTFPRVGRDWNSTLLEDMLIDGFKQRIQNPVPAIFNCFELPLFFKATETIEKLRQLSETTRPVQTIPEFYGYRFQVDRQEDNLTFRLQRLPVYGFAARENPVDVTWWKIKKGEVGPLVKDDTYEDGNELDESRYSWEDIARNLDAMSEDDTESESGDSNKENVPPDGR
jgi:hypothetical protein